MHSTIQPAGAIVGDFELHHQSNPCSPGESLRILIVDDNKDAANGLARLLKALGHDVHTVLEPRSALRSCIETKPHLVLLDIGMPDLNGYEVCRLIRSEPALSKIPVVAVTAFDQPEDRRKSTAAGFDAHLIKPMRLEELQRILDSVSRN
jgi:CheY-like chemotaxis protein